MTDEKIYKMLRQVNGLSNFRSCTECGNPFFVEENREAICSVVRAHLAPYEALRMAAQNVVNSADACDESLMGISDLRQALAALEEPPNE